MVDSLTQQDHVAGCVVVWRCEAALCYDTLPTLLASADSWWRAPLAGRNETSVDSAARQLTHLEIDDANAARQPDAHAAG